MEVPQVVSAKLIAQPGPARSRFDFGWGNWYEMLPETIADYTARVICG